MPARHKTRKKKIMDSKKINAAAKAARAEKGRTKKSAAARKAARKPAKSAAKVERKAAAKAARADKGSAGFEPVKLPAVFHSPDGSGKLEITAASITYSQGLREVIFPARSAHYFARDYKAGERVIAAGSVGVKVGGKSLVIGPEAPAIVAAVRTAKAAAAKAAKVQLPAGGQK